MNYMKELDFVVVEGFKHSKYAKISTSTTKMNLQSKMLMLGI